MAKKKEKENKDKIERLRTGNYCVILNGSSFCFNEYNLDWQDHDNSGKLAVYKKRLTGYSWTRTYDSEWNDVTDTRYGIGESETKEFPALEAYLQEKGIQLNLLKKEYQNQLLSLSETSNYMDDPYYGSAEEEITYILLEDIDNWLKNINSEDYMKETYEEWLEKNFKSLPALREYESNADCGYREGKYQYRMKFEDIRNSQNLYVHHDWSMGGTYGNCWDDHMTTSEGEIKPEFMSLDTVVELINAELSYIKYRTRVIPLINAYTTSHGDYYGGSTTTGHERVNIYELWVALNAV